MPKGDGITAHFTGEKEVQAGFKKLKISEEELKNIALRAYTIIENEAKRILLANGHYITGSLHRSIRSLVDRITKDAVEGRVGSHLDYAFYVEILPDGGYLWPAVVKKGQEVIDYIVAEFNRMGIR